MNPVASCWSSSSKVLPVVGAHLLTWDLPFYFHMLWGVIHNLHVLVNICIVPKLGFHEGSLGGPTYCAYPLSQYIFTVPWRIITFKQGGQNDPAYTVSRANIVVVCFVCGVWEVVLERSSVFRLSQLPACVSYLLLLPQKVLRKHRTGLW